MLKKTLLSLLILALAATVAWAIGNRDRDVLAETTQLSAIGTCQPEDTTGAGWDVDPTSGYWGGKDESEFAVVWEPGGGDVPALAGRMAECTISNSTAYVPKKIKLNVLEGQANDDYCVFASTAAGDLLVKCYDETGGGEQWRDHEWDLPLNAFAAGQDVTVKILVTGNAWSSKDTYGQLAIDYIQVLGE